MPDSFRSIILTKYQGSLRSDAGGWGRGAPADTYWYFSFKSSHCKRYCQQIFPFVQLSYRFLLLALQSYFEALCFYYAKLVLQTLFEPLASAILNLYDENLTSL